MSPDTLAAAAALASRAQSEGGVGGAESSASGSSTLKLRPKLPPRKKAQTPSSASVAIEEEAS